MSTNIFSLIYDKTIEIIDCLFLIFEIQSIKFYTVSKKVL